MTIEIDGNTLEYEFKTDESSGEKHVAITGNGDIKGNLTIPSKIDGCLVTSIGGSAFWDCSGLTSVSLPTRFKDQDIFPDDIDIEVTYRD